MNKTISYIKNHPFIAMLFIIIAALVVAEITSKTVSDFFTTSSNVDRSIKKKPVLEAFTLNKSKSNYIEGEIAKFGTGPQVTTFMAQPKVTEVNSPATRVSYPVFNVVIKNPSNQQLVITKFAYNILDVGHVMVGGGPGPLESTYQYTSKLEYKKGIQEYKLDSPIIIPAKSSGTFEVAMMTEHPALGLSWWTNIEFQSNMENVSTGMFQVILSGRPEWAIKVLEPRRERRQATLSPIPALKQQNIIMPQPAPKQEGVRILQDERKQRPRTPSVLR